MIVSREPPDPVSNPIVDDMMLKVRSQPPINSSTSFGSGIQATQANSLFVVHEVGSNSDEEDVSEADTDEEDVLEEDTDEEDVPEADTDDEDFPEANTDEEEVPEADTDEEDFREEDVPEADTDEEEATENVEEEDDLIKSLKAARQKKECNCPPDIKTSDLITDISFHPESDCIAVSGITGDLSIFKYPNEENKLEKTGQQPRWMDVEGGEDVEGEVV